MFIDNQLVYVLIAACGGFLLSVILMWLYFRSRTRALLLQNRLLFDAEHRADIHVLEIELENLENELDISRELLAEKEQLLYRKIDELSKVNELKAIYATRASRIEEYTQLIEKANQKIFTLTDENTSLQTEIAEISIKTDEKNKSAELIIKNLQHSREELVAQFENLANRIFNENSQQLKQSNQQDINSLLSPFKEQFIDFKRKVEEIHHSESRDRVSLSTQVNQLSSLNQQLSRDAVNLTKALKGDVKIQGDWGEMVLENLLKNSGLREGIEYKTQQSYRDSNNHLQRPDVIIHLPDNKIVIVDSKVSLKHYEQLVSATDETARRETLKLHIQSIKNHIKGLAEKDYTAIDELHTLDFVLLFVPIEPALMLAINEDHTILFDAFNKKIILVSATTLLASLRTIENFWRHDRQQSNADEIARRAGDMLDKFSLFVEELENIGLQLDKAKSSYNLAHNRLVSGNGNLINRALAIQELGIKPRKSIESVQNG